MALSVCLPKEGVVHLPGAVSLQREGEAWGKLFTQNGNHLSVVAKVQMDV